MEHPTIASSLSPAARRWHCHLCDIDVHVSQTILHVELPLHRLRAEGPLRANELAEPANPLTGGDGEEESDCSDESECTDTEEAEEAEEEKEVTDEEDDVVYDELFHAMYREQADEISYEAKLLGEPWLPWTCAVCSTTVNTSRIEHLRSARHLAAVLLQPSGPRPVALTPPTTWTCTLCNTKMPIAHQSMHLTSKRHLKLIRQQNPSPPAPITHKAPQKLPTLARVVKATLARSLPPLRPKRPWNCHHCGEPLGSVLLGTHVALHCSKAPIKSPQRIPSSPKPPNPPHPTGHIHCEVCKTSFIPSTMRAHLAGRKHTKKAAAQQLRTVPAPPVAIPVVACPLRTVTASNRHQGPGTPATTHGRGAGETPATPAVVRAEEPSSYIRVTGNSFYCTVCVRTRMVAGMAGHVASWKHRNNVAKQQAVVR